MGVFESLVYFARRGFVARETFLPIAHEEIIGRTSSG
jgi:hypothetical protein